MSQRPTTLAAILCCMLPATAALAEDGATRVFGDARFSYVASEREARDGTDSSDDSLRARLRVGAEHELSETWLLRGRVAGRYASDQDRTRFWLKAWAPTRTGLEAGDATVDELYLRYAPAGADWSVTAGRFQSKFALKGVASKTLDRADSPNVDITWTDGLHWKYDFSQQWRSHLVLQKNVSSGSGQTARAPLSFDDSDSQVTVFGALEAAQPLGPLSQRLFAVTWMPATLATEGLGSPVRDDYYAFTGKLFAEWPLGAGDMRGGIGGELGYAPNTPLESVFNPGRNGDADGLAGQLSFNLFDFQPGHNITFVYGRAGAGWLLSPDFRNNDTLMEVRYQWRINKTWSMETRIRRREEIDLPPGTPDARIDDDFYLRFSGKF